MGTLAITTLGDPLIQHDAEPCTFTTRKALALTLYLAVTAQPHTRAHLVALLWPEADAAHGSTNLRQTLGRIRQALGSDADVHLLTPGDLVRLDRGTGGTLDLTQIAAAIPATTPSAARLAALGCYGGSFCESLSIDDAPDFMAWVQAQRAHWDACYDVMAEHEVQVCLASGQAEDAVTLGKAWVRLRPDTEVAYRLLATAQATTGDVTGARLTLADCAQVWANLELTLDPATVHLQEQMQALPTTTPASPATHVIRLPFVGRQGAFDQLRRAYEAARAGAPHLALIEGEAGVGKSRLLGAFTQWAALQGADVVLGQAYELSGRFPFQPLAELVRTRLAREHAPDDLLDDPWLTELSRLVPDLRERYPDLPTPTDDAGAGARLIEALAQVGLALARARPVVWVLEDLHWADEATRAALTALLGRWGTAGAAILLVVTVRAEERATSPELHGWVAAAERLAPVVPITLAAFSAADSQHAAMKLLSDTASLELCEWLFAVTAGNPLYLEQVAQGLVERGVVAWQDDALRSTPDLDVSQLADWVPETLRELLLRRIRYLDTTTQRVVAAAAVAGGRFTEEVVQAIAGVDEDALLTALEVAERRQLIRSEGNQYGFTHDKVAEAMYSDLHPGRRRVMHRRALTALAERQTATPADLFRHAKGAEAWEQAAQYARQAFIAAGAIGAQLDALTFGENFIGLLTSEPSRAVVQAHYSVVDQGLFYSRLGNLYINSGRYAQAHGLYSTLLMDARAANIPYLEGMALYLLGKFAAENQQDLTTSQHRQEAALQIFTMLGDTNQQISAMVELAAIFLARGDIHNAYQQLQQALSLARGLHHTFKSIVCLHAIGNILTKLGEWEAQCSIMAEGLFLLPAYATGQERDEGLARSAVTGPLDWEALLVHLAPVLQVQPTDFNSYARQWSVACLLVMSIGQLHVGEAATGKAAQDVAWDIIAQRKEVLFYHQYLLPYVWGRLEMGDYGQAYRQVEQITGDRKVAVSRPLNPTMVQTPMATVDLNHALLQLTAAQPLLEEATGFAAEKPAWDRLLPATRWCTHYALLGDWSAATIAAINAQAVRATTPTQLNAFDLARYYETEALLRAGERKRAQADADALAAALGTNRRYRLMWLRMQALLDHDAGDHATAIAHLREATELAEAMGLPGEQWPVAAALAAQFARQGDVAASQRALAQAETVIADLAASITDVALRDHFAREARQRLPQG